MNINKKLLSFMLVGVLSLSLCGCGKEGAGAASTESTQIKMPYTAALKQYGLAGETVLQKKPERIVCLANTPVLTLHRLGLKLVGIPKSKVVEWPKELKEGAELLEVGMKSNIDIEKVIALKPDLVFVGYHGKETYGKILEREKIPVYYVDAGPTVTYNSIKELNEVLINGLGQKNEEGAKIKQEFAALEKRMETEKAKNKQKKVMILQAVPPRYFIQNKNGTVGTMADLIGLTNVSDSQGGTLVVLDQEKALSYNPDLVICLGAGETEAQQQKIMEEGFAQQSDYWQQIKAIKNKRIIYLPRTYAVSGGLNVLDNINGLIDKVDRLEVGSPNVKKDS